MQHLIRPFTVLVVDDAAHAGGSALDAAARMSLRIPNAGIHALFVVPHGVLLGELQDIATSLRADTMGRAAALGANQSVLAVHVHTGDLVEQIARTAAEVSADLVVIGARERGHLRGVLKRSELDRLHTETETPIVVAGTADATPDIDPPCIQCEKASGFCARHRVHHPRAHRYNYNHEAEAAYAGSEFTH